MPYSNSRNARRRAELAELREALAKQGRRRPTPPPPDTRTWQELGLADARVGERMTTPREDLELLAAELETWPPVDPATRAAWHRNAQTWAGRFADVRERLSRGEWVLRAEEPRIGPPSFGPAWRRRHPEAAVCFLACDYIDQRCKAEGERWPATTIEALELLDELIVFWRDIAESVAPQSAGQ